MLKLLLIVLLFAALASLPTWPHSRQWGYYPSGGISVVFVIILVLFLAHYL